MSFRLPIGFKVNGTAVKDVELNELDGFAREVIADKKFRNNPAKMTSVLLARCINDLGGKRLIEEEVCSMFTPDRNAIMVYLQLLSVGNEIPAKYSCSWCETGFEVVEDLSNLKFTESDSYKETVTLELAKGYKDQSGTVHTKVTFGIPTGVDEEVTAPVLRSNYGEWCNLMIARKAIEFGTLDMKKFAGLGVKVAQTMNIKDIDMCIKAMITDLPGFDLRHKVLCPNCNKTDFYIQDMSSFF